MSETRTLLIGGLDATAALLGEALRAIGVAVQYAGEAQGEFALPYTPLPADDQAGVREAVAALEPFTVAVLLPGWRQFAPFMDTSSSDWDEALERNFEHMVYAAQACAKRLIAHGQGGRLIFVTGVTALMPFAGASGQGTTLAALHAIARMAAVDLAPHSITSNVIAPGWLAGGDFDTLPAAAQAHVRAGIPLARPAEPAEIAGLIAFLASDAGAYLTGAILPADGGYTLTRSDGRGWFEA